MENKKNPHVTNWTCTERYEHRKEALKAVHEFNETHKGMKQVVTPHPEYKNTYILKYN
jgi:hypothetical protein